MNIYSLNTRRAVRGRGTDRQGNTSNNTNMFHLGTRLPSLGPSDLEHWDKVFLYASFLMPGIDVLGQVDPPLPLQQRYAASALEYQTKSVEFSDGGR